MDDSTFMFGVIPLTIGFVAFVYSLVFGPGILRWYNDQKALQQQRANSPTAPYTTKQAA
ncbi:MAG: hypothetical protein K8T89_16670 [Planctomycetes bacterium]|nr:hypothetical protein [Planctomycetota bacterium]